MINYLKKNIVSILIGCVIGIPLSWCAVHHKEPATIPVYYEPGLFEQFEQVEFADTEDLKVNFQSCEMTDEDMGFTPY